MMQIFKLLAGVLIATFLAACGGGGGSAGTTTGGTGGGVTPASSTITLELIDGAGAATTVVSNVTPVFARAVFKDGNGAPVAGQVIAFSQESGLARFLPESGTALTDANGVATVQVLPLTATSAGAAQLKVETIVGSVTISKTLTFSVPSGSSDTATSRVTNYVVLLDKSTLPNSGAATVKVTIVAVDVNNNAVAGATVAVSTNANTVYVPGTTTTNAQGEATGTISIGSDKTDRLVTVTTTVNSIVKQTTFQIAGTSLDVSVAPPVLSPSAASTVTARLTDSAGVAIAGKTVTFTSDIASLTGRTATTDSTGAVTVGFTAPAASGSYIVTAAANGVTKQVSAQVGSSATIPAAVIPADAIPSLAAIPNVLAPNASGSTASQTQLKFLALNAANQPIANVRVRFRIASTGLGSSDSTISTGSSIVYTNASGVATASFIAGPTGSPTDGITVEACYSDNDFAAGTCPRGPVAARLTIAAQALAVSIGNNDTQLLTPEGTYIRRFVVTVADAAGRAVVNAPVDISLDITHYGKGGFLQDVTFPLGVADSNTYVPDATTLPSDFGKRVSCINEDKNRNGFVDAGENINGSVDSFGQATLEPRRSDMIMSYDNPAVTTTNASGILLIKVEYSQRFASWLAYRIRATTTVSGSQGSAERIFVTAYNLGDDVTGSFKTPPYGTKSCSDPN